MYQIKNSQKGFGAIGVVVIVVVVGLLGGGGYVVYKNQHKTAPVVAQSSDDRATATTDNASPESAMPKGTISTSDKKVSIVLPAAWTVMVGLDNRNGEPIISTNTSTRICSKYNPNDCGVAGCLDVDDTSPCIYEASFQPKVLKNDPAQPRWSLQIEKTGWTIAQAMNSRLGILSASNTAARNANPINGYDAQYVAVTGGADCGGECYTDLYYFVKHDGYLITLYNREKYTNDSTTPPTKLDYSKYAPDFAQIANSLKLNL